jgi:hypothetical protein
MASSAAIRNTRKGWKSGKEIKGRRAHLRRPFRVGRWRGFATSWREIASPSARLDCKPLVRTNHSSVWFIEPDRPDLD